MTTQPTTPAPTGAMNGTMAGVTTVNLIVIAVAMLLVVIAIIYGIRQRRLRRAAEQQEDQRIDAMGGAPPLASPEPTPSTAGAGEPPVAPVPAPLAGGDEPRPAADVFSTAPAVTTNEPAPAAAIAPGDDTGPLTQLKGLGPKAVTRLGELGITRLSQLAQLDEDEAEHIDAQLGPFRGRLVRDRWVEQARFLAAGDRSGFEAVFGRL